MKPEFERLNKLQKGIDWCLKGNCSMCPYEGEFCDENMMNDALKMIEHCLELQKIIDEAKIIPTLEEAQEYLMRQGYPEADFADAFCSLAGKRRAQFWECVRNNYPLCDFDRWQHFQNAIKGEISWEDFCKIDNILCEYDIEIMEMDTKEETLYGPR